MVDVNALAQPESEASAPGTDADPEALRRAMELLFYAYRDITSEPDRRLADYGFGRAHHRVIHFVRRNPGMSVAELLALLRVTKQSLARVLRQLVDRGFVEQRTDPADGRLRRLHLTAEGDALENLVSRPQQDRLAAAFQKAGPQAAAGYRRVLWELLDDDDKAAMQRDGGPEASR